MNYIICHYGEIALKGKNRKFFEETLVKNIKLVLEPAFFEFVKRISGRIIIKLTEKGIKNQKGIKQALSNIFGISYFAFAQSCKQEIQEIQKKAFEVLTLYRTEGDKTFKIATQRSKKEFPLTSQKINEQVGEFVLNKLKAQDSKIKVDLGNPDITCFIEIVEKYAFLYLEKNKGPGGLPVGVSGKAVSLLSGGIDSPVASFLAMKRGIKVVFLHFVINRASIKKVKKLVKILNKFQFQSKLHLIPFSQIQKEIAKKAKPKLRCIFCKRMMLRIGEVIAKKENVQVLITGENIGQVASQTLENLTAIESATDFLILRPLASFNKEEIINLAKKIGTFETSILPEKICPILLKHPETKADLKEVEKAEKELDIEKLIKETIKKSSVLFL